MQIQHIMHFYLYSTANHFRTEKIQIHKTLIKPVAIYGAVSSTMNTDIAKRLAIFERKVLRRKFEEIKVSENLLE
jgi:hypothetical protein